MQRAGRAASRLCSRLNAGAACASAEPAALAEAHAVWARSCLRASSSQAAAADGGLAAFVRDSSGSTAAGRMRKEGRVPGIVFSQFGGDKVLVWLAARDVQRQLQLHNRSGFLSRTVELELHGEDGAVREKVVVLPKLVHKNAVTNVVENVTFMRCPPDAIVKVDVPVLLLGQDACPGLKKGGLVNFIRRKLPCTCIGSAVPPNISIDMSKLDVGQMVKMSQLQLPQGVSLRTRDTTLPVVKIMGRVSRAGAEAAADAPAATPASAVPSAKGAPPPPAAAAKGAAPAAAGKAPAK